MNDKKHWTGERLETFITNETMQEHLHRYALSLQFIQDKKVLDIACGEGYGTHILSRKANDVTGIDIDKATIEKAIKKYKQENINFKTGSILAIPESNNNFDVITCFETLEHVEDHDTVLNELKRVLKPEGIIIISTPDKATYTDKPGYQNTFHKKELYEEEFKKLMKEHFKYITFYSQSSLTGSFIVNEENNELRNYYIGDYKEIGTSSKPITNYWIAIASDKELPAISSSLFYHPKSVSQIEEEQTDALKKTLTYRVGHFILYPLKFIRSFFNK